MPARSGTPQGLTARLCKTNTSRNQFERGSSANLMTLQGNRVVRTRCSATANQNREGRVPPSQNRSRKPSPLLGNSRPPVGALRIAPAHRGTFPLSVGIKAPPGDNPKSSGRSTGRHPRRFLLAVDRSPNTRPVISVGNRALAFAQHFDVFVPGAEHRRRRRP